LSSTLQELWDPPGNSFGEPDVDLPKHVAEAALRDGTYEDISAVQVGIAGINFQEGGETATAPLEPEFKDTGAAAESDEETAEQELPTWTCACVPFNTSVCLSQSPTSS
jgi:hypothetical protein